MQFTKLAFAASLASMATALPTVARSPETVSVTNTYIRKNPDPQSVSFDLYTGDSAKLTCSGDVQLQGAAVPCAEGSEYKFGLNAGFTDSSYELILHRTLDPIEESRSGQTTINVYCHAGGNGPQDFVCAQVGGAATATIKPYGEQ